MAIVNFDADQDRLRIKAQQEADQQANLEFAVSLKVDAIIDEKVQAALAKN